MPFNRRGALRTISSLAVAGLGLAGPVRAQSFPSKPIRIIVPFSAGSGSDDNSRFYAELMQKRLGQAMVVENKPGGSGVLAANTVKAAPADGYTILLASNSLMAVNPLVIKDLPYDPFKDFRPLHGIMASGAVLVTSIDSPVKSVADLIALSKREKRPLTIGNYSEGYQLLGTWLGHAGGVPITPVPYKGGAAMVTDVIGGRLDAGLNDASGVMQMINTGKLRGLAITSAERDPKLPDVPTMKEQGFPDFESYVWTSFYVRAETPDDVTRVLAQALRDSLSSPESQARVGSRPGKALNLMMAEMGQFQRQEYERFRKVAVAAGLQPR